MRAAFIRRMVAEGAADEPPFGLDYWRLNMMAQRPAE
jgi:hypothetical protein